MKLRNKVLFIAVSALLFSCGEQPFYEKVYSFDGREWPQDVKPSYEVDFQKIDVEYDFTLSLRTSIDYQYSNLWVFMKTETPDGTTAREPFQIKITNDDGSWIGENSGSIVTTQLYFRRRQMPIKGIYKFTLEQGITESKIDEVIDLSFRVDEATTDEEQ
ncbi:MAG: gliding motility-associated lipoprotein GldH [Crocinitomicaceae bacterium]|jgi:gliding motility-associated lipoprotein GldH